MGKILEETHEFRQGYVSELCSIVLFVLGITNRMNKTRFNALLRKKRRQSQIISDDSGEVNTTVGQSNDQIKKNKTTDHENEINNLVFLCKVVFAVVYIETNDNVTSSVHVHYYDKHYTPLYLCNKNNDELITIFEREDDIIKILLRKFFKEKLKYDQYVRLNDDIDMTASEISLRIQHEPDYIPSSIGLSNCTNASNQQLIEQPDTCSSMCDITTETLNTNEENQPIKAFQSPKSNGKEIKKIYKSVDEFKQAFSLNDIRFAITLWIKESREKGFCRHDEIQYISQISTQNSKAKVGDNPSS